METFFSTQIRLISFVTCALVLISGCSTTLNRPQNLRTLHHPKAFKTHIKVPQNFETHGKLGFSDGKKGGNAYIQWQQAAGEYHIRLYGPLGSGSLQINGDPKTVALVKEDGQIIHANTPEALVKSELGWVIPVSGLRSWILGTVAPGHVPEEVQIDDQNRLWQIEQQGWTITYQSYETWQNQQLPSKLTLRNGPLRLKFVLSAWELSP